MTAVGLAGDHLERTGQGKGEVLLAHERRLLLGGQGQNGEQCSLREQKAPGGEARERQRVVSSRCRPVV